LYFSENGTATGHQNRILQEKVLSNGKNYSKMAIDTCPNDARLLQSAAICKRNVT